MTLRRGFGFENKIYLKSSSPELLGSSARNLVRSINKWSFTKFVQMKASDPK